MQELKLDIGGGRNPLPDHVNIDLRPLPEVDVQASASDLPYPDDSVNRIHANSLVPHIPDLNQTMSEFSRVLEPGGELVLKATHANSTGIRDDPDHHNWSWTSSTPSWYDSDSEWAYYHEATLKLVEVNVVGWLRPYRWWLRPTSWIFGQVIDTAAPDMADELMKAPLAGGRVVAQWKCVE